MSCPWLENRESKDFEKTTKYSQLRLELTNRYSEHKQKVNQYNIIMEVLGGCSKEIEQNIKELAGDAAAGYGLPPSQIFFFVLLWASRHLHCHNNDNNNKQLIKQL